MSLDDDGLRTPIRGGEKREEEEEGIQGRRRGRRRRRGDEGGAGGAGVHASAHAGLRECQVCHHACRYIIIYTHTSVAWRQTTAAYGRIH